MFSRLTFKSDRRRRTRQMVNTSVRVFTPDGTIEALGINISQVGMCLFTVANLPVGSEIQIELPLENDEVKRIHTIIRYRALYLYGVEFQENYDPGRGAHSADLKAEATRVDSLPLE